MSLLLAQNRKVDLWINYILVDYHAGDTAGNCDKEFGGETG